jgi:hypothetical protein
VGGKFTKYGLLLQIATDESKWWLHTLPRIRWIDNIDDRDISATTLVDHLYPVVLGEELPVPET